MIVNIDGLKVACQWDWFKSWEGIFSLVCASLIVVAWVLIELSLETKDSRKSRNTGEWL